MNLAADFLTANGFTEIMSNSLTKAAYYEGLTSIQAGALREDTQSAAATT